MKYFLYSLTVLLFVCCKKDRKLRFTIEGQLLESSSNPRVITDYEIQISQSSQTGIFGSVSGILQTAKTGIDGRFTITYSSGRDYGFVTTGVNRNSIFINGVDNMQYPDIRPQWRELPSSIDTNLNILYLYKKIDTLIIKVNFINALITNDTLALRPGNSGDYSYLAGPITAGQTIAIDTLLNIKLSSFYIPRNIYPLDIQVKSKNRIYHHNSQFGKQDERYSEILVSF